MMAVEVKTFLVAGARGCDGGDGAGVGVGDVVGGVWLPNLSPGGHQACTLLNTPPPGGIRQ